MVLSLISKLPGFSAPTLLLINRYLILRTYDVILIDFDSSTAKYLIEDGGSTVMRPADYRTMYERWVNDECDNVFNTPSRSVIICKREGA